MKSRIRNATQSLFRLGSVQRAAYAVAVARRRALVIVYHRVLPDEEALRIDRDAIVPCVSTAALREQLAFLQRAGRIVPLSELVTQPLVEDDRLRFCITFDDDEPSHVLHALPILEASGVPATFFLSGRSLHGLGPPWWRLLEAEVERAGLYNAASALGVTARTPAELAARIEDTQAVALVERAFTPPERDSQLSDRGIVRLARAPQMTIGFHTLKHPVLTRLDEDGVIAALSAGRDSLEALTGTALRFLAYPHGKTDRRVAALASRAGYDIACQGLGRPLDISSDVMRLPRWEPGNISLSEFAARMAFRLSLPAQPA